MQSTRSTIAELRDEVDALLAQVDAIGEREDVDRFDHDAYRAAFEAELALRGREDMQAFVEAAVKRDATA